MEGDSPYQADQISIGKAVEFVGMADFRSNIPFAMGRRRQLAWATVDSSPVNPGYRGSTSNQNHSMLQSNMLWDTLYLRSEIAIPKKTRKLAGENFSQNFDLHSP
jgi:hypothetical protein